MATARMYRGHWVADYYDANKRRRIERPEGHFETASQELQAAQVLLADRVAEMADGIVHLGRGTFEGAATRWLKGKVRVRPSTRRIVVTVPSVMLLRGSSNSVAIAGARVLLTRFFRIRGRPPCVSPAEQRRKPKRR